MRDFEIAAIVLIAWVLLGSSLSRVRSRHDVTSVTDKWRLAFKNCEHISWEKISFIDDSYDYRIYQEGSFYQHEFVIKHSYGNEFTFRNKGDAFEIRDRYGKTCTIELHDYDHVVLTWRGSEANKNYYRVG